MKNKFSTRIISIFVGVISLLSLSAIPATAAALSIVNNWQDPAPYSFYSFGNAVHVTGSYTLPPDWVGTIYVWQDGLPLAPTQLVSNLGGAAAKVGTFDINLVIQSPIPSPHSISIEFFGGASCFILGTCSGTSNNWIDESIVPRTYTAAAAPDPVLSISYDANGTLPLASPAFNFSNVVENVPDTRTLYVHNVGGGTATGLASISGGPNPFYCVGSCNYSIAAGAPAVPIQVQYLPGVAGLNSSGVLNFGCTSLNCAQVNANLIGNSVASSLPPQISLDQSYLSFGTVNVGDLPVDRVVTLTNTGGGILNGTITIPGTNYTCLPSCTYSVASGDSLPITIRFTAAGDGGRDTTATFSGAGTLDLDLYAYSNNKPIIDINCIACTNQDHWDITAPVAPGNSVFQDVEVRNVGVGILNGHLSVTPGPWNADGWHCVGVTQGGVTTPFTDATPCTFTSVAAGGPPAIVHMEFRGSAANAGARSNSVEFRNDSNAGDGDTLWMTATVSLDAMLQINNLPDAFWMPDSLINVASSYTFTLVNLGSTPISPIINLPVGAGVFTCANAAQCNAPLIIPGNSAIPITLNFTPLLPQGYTQGFSICINSVCGNFTVSGQGQDPQLEAHISIPSGLNMDAMLLCSDQDYTCNFTGTQTVYYGDDTHVVSGTFTDSVYCQNSNEGGPAQFINPIPGTPKHCWIVNPDAGTWINNLWSTRAAITLGNKGTGGTIDWKIVSPTNFKCKSSVLPPCSGTIYTNNNDTGIFQEPSPSIFFNPTIAGLVGQTVTVQYRYFAWKNGGTPSDCPGSTYCHTANFAMTGTGISGPRISYVLDPFPTTNINDSSTVNLTINNNGTAIDQQVKVDYVSGQFSCTANCGPYDINPDGNFVAKLTFSPTGGAGVRNGQFAINSTNVASIPVPVTGMSNTSPLIGILPVSGFIDYGTVNEGSKLNSGTGGVAKIIVTNTGAGLLTGDATIVNGTHYICVSCHYEALAPGDTAEVIVAFRPLNVGSLPDVLNFSGGGGGSINLFGVGALGASSINSPDASFGRVVIRPGNYKEQIVTVFNQGSVDVPAGDITLTGPFTCVPPTPINIVTGKCTYPGIVAGGSTQFTIRFTPVTPGTANGVLSLSGSSNARVRLTGIGVVPSVKFKEK